MGKAYKWATASGTEDSPECNSGWREHIVKRQELKEGKPTDAEDDPELFKQAVYKQTTKPFAELYIKRKERDAKTRTKQRLKLKKKTNEKSRDGQVDSWWNLQASIKGKKT